MTKLEEANLRLSTSLPSKVHHWEPPQNWRAKEAAKLKRNSGQFQSRGSSLSKSDCGKPVKKVHLRIGKPKA